MSFVNTITAQDSKTFTIKLKEPTGLLIRGLGKPSWGHLKVCALKHAPKKEFFDKV
jgi:hypothetical protein